MNTDAKGEFMELLELAAHVLPRFPRHLHLQVKFKPPVNKMDRPH